MFAVLLAVSFLSIGGPQQPPFVPPLRALADAPLPLLAQVVKTSPAQLRERLQRAGVNPRGDDDPVHSLVGDDTRAQIRVLSQVMATAGG
jgi:hypothetical protein